MSESKLGEDRLIEAWEKFAEPRGEACREVALRSILWTMSFLPLEGDREDVNVPNPGNLLGDIVSLTIRAFLPGENILETLLDEYRRAAAKHPNMTLDSDNHTDTSRFMALAEEVGEVAACLTYDNDCPTGHNSDLEDEALQVAALALAWAARYI